MSGDPVAFSNTSAVDICSCVYLITCQALHSPTFRPHAPGNTVYVKSIEVFVKMTGTTSTNYVLMTVPVNASFTNVAK